MTWVMSPVGINDNGTPWDHGFADGKVQGWSSEVANQDGQAAQSYLAGWIAAAEQPMRPMRRLRIVRNW